MEFCGPSDHPRHFELKPIEKTQARFNLIKRLLKRADIDEVINACDAGREGELSSIICSSLPATRSLPAAFGCKA